MPERPCTTCPFDHSDEVENAINLGCVPSDFEIMEIKRVTGQNWGCHSAEHDDQRICAGFVRACREEAIEYRGSPLLTYQRWFHGPEAPAEQLGPQR